jgi:hypothetical protein
MANLTNTHFDRPIEHSQTRTRWLLNPNQKIFANSIKIIDLNISNGSGPAAYFNALTGGYACVKRAQLMLDGEEVDLFYAGSILPYMLSESGDNERQKGVNSVLFSTGNNIAYDSTTQQMSLERPLVGANPLTLKLSVYLNLLSKIGIINQKVELIIDWETKATNLMVPVTAGNQVSIGEIQQPFLTYETLIGDWEQPAQVFYQQYVEDQFIVTALASAGAVQSKNIRSNAFNNKSISRMLLTNTPDLTTITDLGKVTSVFGNKYFSVAQFQENYNLLHGGETILQMRNVNNDAMKLSTVHDCFGDGVFITNGHLNVKFPVLKELQSFDPDTGALIQGNQLTSFCSYGAIEVNQKIKKELQLIYQRTVPSDGNATLPSLCSDLTISCVGEVLCQLVNGKKIYV